jgi:hypothetical protein
MIGNKAFVVLAAAVAVSVLGAASQALAGSDRYPRGGFVMPGSLDGVNPAYHPGIFGNPAAATHMVSSNRGTALGTCGPIGASVRLTTRVVKKRAPPRLASGGALE